jgi:hypothetical protein
VLVAGVVVLALLINDPPSVPRASNQPPGAPSARPALASDGNPAPSASAGRRCEALTLNAPSPGRWQLHRAEYGSRGRDDYLRLLLRRHGESDTTAALSAELVSRAEVRERAGLDPPGGAERVLVVRFDGPVDAAGRFGGRGPGALGEFVVAQAQAGATHVLAAVNGLGCFRAGDAGWATGESGAGAVIELLIERR